MRQESSRALELKAGSELAGRGKDLCGKKVREQLDRERMKTQIQSHRTNGTLPPVRTPGHASGHLSDASSVKAIPDISGALSN